jgi:predicted MFS family arabinose efflux permease
MFLQYAFPGALLQLFSVHLEETLKFDARWTGLCGATQAIGTIVVALFVGQAADRWYSAERVLAGCSFLAGIALLVLGELTGLPAVFATMLVFWLLAAAVLLLGTTICFSQLPQPERDFGSVRLWGTVGWMVPGWLLLLWRKFGGSGDGAVVELFRVGAAFAILLAVYALTLPATPPRRESVQRSAPLAALRLLRSWDFAVYALCTFGVSVTYPFSTQATPLLLARLGVAREWLSPILTLAQVSEVIALALLPFFLLRLRLRGTMVLGLAAWVTALTILSIGAPAGLMIGSLGFNGLLISGFFVAGQIHVNRSASDGLRASAQALLTFVNAGGLLVGHLLVGYLRWSNGGDLLGTFGVAAGISTGVLLLYVVGFREHRAVVVETTEDSWSEPVPLPRPSKRTAVVPKAEAVRS